MGSTLVIVCLIITLIPDLISFSVIESMNERSEWMLSITLKLIGKGIKVSPTLYCWKLVQWSVTLVESKVSRGLEWKRMWHLKQYKMLEYKVTSKRKGHGYYSVLCYAKAMPSPVGLLDASLITHSDHSHVCTLCLCRVSVLPEALPPDTQASVADHYRDSLSSPLHDWDSNRRRSGYRASMNPTEH